MFALGIRVSDLGFRLWKFEGRFPLLDWGFRFRLVGLDMGVTQSCGLFKVVRIILCNYFASRSYSGMLVAASIKSAELFRKKAQEMSGSLQQHLAYDPS